MKGFKILLIVVAVIGMMGCGPSAQSMADKSCALYEKYNQALQANDTTGMRKYELEMADMDKKLIEEYQHKNPEWLMKYVKLRDACLKKSLN
jgi:hypothetical protein